MKLNHQSTKYSENINLIVNKQNLQQLYQGILTPKE